jgi:hypothetical protein
VISTVASLAASFSSRANSSRITDALPNMPPKRVAVDSASSTDSPSGWKRSRSTDRIGEPGGRRRR